MHVSKVAARMAGILAVMTLRHRTPDPAAGASYQSFLYFNFEGWVIWKENCNYCRYETGGSNGAGAVVPV